MTRIKSLHSASTQRLEVYVDSYNSAPFVHEMDRTHCINIGDEISKEDWLDLLCIPGGTLALKVKVEDVRHLFWDDGDCRHSVTIKVVLVE